MSTKAFRYDFDQGLPDPDLYPVEDLRRYFDVVLRRDGAQACTYFGGSHSEDMRYGHLGLRQAIAQWLSGHEACDLGAHQILLANGSTNGIAMAINALVGPGDAALVEEVSYPYARQFIEAAGATVFTVPVDDEGMDTDVVAACFEAAVSAGLRPRLIYTVATFHSPTGTVLAMERRRSLVEQARKWGVMVLDDNCYYHLYYDEAPPTSLVALNGGDDGPVVQSGSFSKYLAPGLRMAWLAGPSAVIEAIAAKRQDFAVSQLMARVIEGYVQDGLLDTHLVDLRRVYGEKRDLAAGALGEHCGRWVRFRQPGGGIYFWLEVDQRVDYDAAVARAGDLGISLRPGVRFVDPATGSRHLRLSVAQSPLGDIEPGIALLGRALADAVVAPR